MKIEEKERKRENNHCYLAVENIQFNLKKTAIIFVLFYFKPVLKLLPSSVFPLFLNYYSKPQALMFLD